MQDLQLAAADGAFPAVSKLGRGTATDPGCFPNIRGEAGLHFFISRSGALLGTGELEGFVARCWYHFNESSYCRPVAQCVCTLTSFMVAQLGNVPHGRLSQDELKTASAGNIRKNTKKNHEDHRKFV